jgi:hypothetical protein
MTRITLPEALTDSTQRDYLSAHIADLFDDGSPEILLGGWATEDRDATETVHVLSFDEDSLSLASEFGSCALATHCLIQDVKTADFNGDGRLDIATLESQADYSDGMAITIYLQNTSDEFIKSDDSFPDFDDEQSWSKFMFPMDWDCDGDVDIIVDQMPHRGDNVYLNNGSGVFASIETTSTNSTWTEVTVDPINKRIFRVWNLSTVNVELFAQGSTCN